MNKDDEIRLGLKAAGIPESVYSTTLVIENAQPLRDMITSRSLMRPSGATGVFVTPTKGAEAMRARRIFYLLAKELFLSGTTVCCLPATRLIEALNSDDYSGEAMLVDKVKAVFVTDFFEDGAPFPFTALDAAKIRAWVRQRYERGDAVSFLSDAPAARCTQWWPISFLGFISDHTVAYPV